MVNSIEFASRLEKVIEEYDLNASSFAEKIDVGRSSISHILSGRNKPSLDFVMKIVQAFPEVELYWLLNGKGSFPKEDNPAPKTVEEKPAQHQPTDLFSKVEPSDVGHIKAAATSSKEISKIVIFYTDGTFEHFTQQETF